MDGRPAGGNTAKSHQKGIEKAAAKSAKAKGRADRAKARIPKEKEYSLDRVFDEKTGKSRYVLKTVEKERMFKPDGIAKRTAYKVTDTGLNFVHAKVSEHEKENSAVEAAHKTQRKAEDAYRHIKGRKKTNLQKKRDRAQKLEKKQFKAEAEFEYRKFVADNPQLEKKTARKRMQKQRIKREYIKARRAGETAKAASAAFENTSKATKIAKKLQDMIAKSRTALVSAGGFSLLIVMVMSAMSSCGSVLGSSITTTLGATYLSMPEAIDAADLSMTQKEMELKFTIDNIENDYPGYDEYEYFIGDIGHNPFELINYLSAVNTEFTQASAEGQVQAVFDGMYELTTEPRTETRTRTVTKTGTKEVTDDDGSTYEEEYTYTEEEEYTVEILTVTLSVTALTDVVAGGMTPDQEELYSVYDDTKGGLQTFASPLNMDWYGKVSCYYGYRKHPISGERQYHKGVDIAVPTGTEVYAGHDGTVVTAQYSDSYGNYVVITDSKGYTTKYAHMDSLSVSAGQTVTSGTVIGLSGNTGKSTGSHLHIECLYNGEYYNPIFYFDSGVYY